MFRDSHPVHEKVGKIFKEAIPTESNLTLLLDQVCGGTEHIPLFCSPEKSRANVFCNVDLLLLKNDEVKIIVEIEESDVKPTQICGKMLTSALSSHYIHQNSGNKPVKMADSVLFIQVVDTSSLVIDRTAKVGQWRALEKSIRNVLPINKITEYRLLTTDELKNIKELIKQFL